MTCREKLRIEHPEKIGSMFRGRCEGCPHDYGYLDRPRYCVHDFGRTNADKCYDCWNREIPGTESNMPKMKESTINQMLKGDDYDDEPDKRSVEELLEENAKLSRMLESKNGLIGTLKQQLRKTQYELIATQKSYYEMEDDLLRKLSDAERRARLYKHLNDILEKKVKDLGGEI